MRKNKKLYNQKYRINS